MAGGIYTDKPFELNWKCVVVAALTILLAHLIDTFGWSIILDPILFIFVYIGLASYDYLYDCDNQLKTGKYGPAGPLTTIFKPGQTKEDAPVNRRNVYIFHLILLPLILYTAVAQGKTPKVVFVILGAFATLGILYHGVKLSHYLFDKPKVGVG